MDPVSLQHIVQAGAVGISVALIFLIWKIYEKCFWRWLTISAL